LRLRFNLRDSVGFGRVKTTIARDGVSS